MCSLWIVWVWHSSADFGEAEISELEVGLGWGTLVCVLAGSLLCVNVAELKESFTERGSVKGMCRMWLGSCNRKDRVWKGYIWKKYLEMNYWRDGKWHPQGQSKMTIWTKHRNRKDSVKVYSGKNRDGMVVERLGERLIRDLREGGRHGKGRKRMGEMETIVQERTVEPR